MHHVTPPIHRTQGKQLAQIKQDPFEMPFNYAYGQNEPFFDRPPRSKALETPSRERAGPGMHVRYVTELRNFTK
jgi:hypothetical protein